MSYYRLMSALPSLPEVPEAPPISLGEVIDQVMVELEDDEQNLGLVLALLGTLDCRNVENLLQGFPTFDERGPLSKAAIEDRDGLPEFLERFIDHFQGGAIAETHPFDALWREYYTSLVELAEESGNAFMVEWVSYELTLRDALVRYRAEELGEKADLRESGVDVDEGESHQALLSTLVEVTNPMERERLLDGARLKKIELLSGIDPFSIDAVLAYLAAMLILDRWDLAKAADVTKMLEVFA